MDFAGLIFDESQHYLDHLGPFCALKQCPLIICEEAIATLARHYYPQLEVIEANPLRLQLPKQIVACDTGTLLKAAFPHLSFEKTYWLPHGNSDKGWKSPFFEALQGEQTAFVYGQKMIDFIRAKNGSPEMIRVGNFRLQYFTMHRKFYEQLVREEIRFLPGNQNFLYAPTWDDSEGNNSFWKAFPRLAKRLPANVNLIVKLHPNTRKQFPAELEQLLAKWERKNILFLEEFPPIYPLLSICDAYIGDMSSIGYDFISFDRPLFFINANQRDRENDPGLYLYRCGKEIDPETFDFQLTEDTLSPIRKQVYDYTFL